MKRAIAATLLLLTLTACTPVVDPARWDSTMYCKMIKELGYGECK